MQSTEHARDAQNRMYPHLKVDRHKLKSKALHAPIDQYGRTVLDANDEKHRGWFELFKK